MFASVGSANASRRSFLLDTEANVAFYEPASVKTLRLQVWKVLLGANTEGWAVSEFVAKWSRGAALCPARALRR